MIETDNKLYYCETCNRTMRGDQFYTSNNLEKYPNDGKLPTCKKCTTLLVDNWDPQTYLWILQEVDVPYIPEEWDKLMATYGKDRSKLTGMSIIGRYLSKMKLKQFKDYRWKDSDFLQQMTNNKIEQAMKRQGYDAQQIATAIDRATPIDFAGGGLKPQEIPDMSKFNPALNYADENYFDKQNGIEHDPADDLDLTEEDKLYLRMKWGKAYKPEEWVRLEQLYEEMMNSYDIQGAGHIDTLKLICKTSLKANQLIDIGDIEGFQKVSKVYDNLMKSGKFTAAQNKAESGEFVDSVGELIEMCEKQGYIERYYIDEPNDKVDLTIKDMQKYTRTLIEEETNLSNMIEAAIKANAKEDAEAKENEEDDIVDEENLSIDDVEKSLQDKDFEDYNDFLDEERESDLNSWMNEEDE